MEAVAAGRLFRLREHQELRGMRILIRFFDAEVCDLEIFVVRHLFHEHIIPGSFRVPIEEDGADLTDFARDVPLYGT